MDKHMQEAIETVDNARQHKCELEEKRSLLKNAIEQVEHSAELSRKEIARYFDELKASVLKACESKADSLMKEVDEIEQEALSPLIDCRSLVQEGIDEAETVLKAGDKLLHDDGCDSEVHQKEFKSFTDMANNIALDSVPEVPSLIEVVCISAVLDETLPMMLVQTLESEGGVSRRPPVQLSELQARPGGILVSWLQMEEDSASIDDMDDEDEVGVLYKLQSCVGKPTTVFKNGRPLKETANFKDEYIGPLNEYLVKGITPNTIYTFRVCCCKSSASNDVPKIWSPWSIYQQKLTTMPPHRWELTKESGEAYNLSNKQQTVSKTVKRELAIYTKPSEHLMFFPVTFRVDAAGKARGPSDCFAMCFKRELDATNLHLKEGTFCFHSDGTVWVNGKASKTRFANFHRGMVVSFLVTQDSYDNNSGFKKSLKTTNTTRYCVALSLGDREAVFHWQPFRNMTPCPAQDLCLALMFKSPGWKVTIL